MQHQEAAELFAAGAERLGLDEHSPALFEGSLAEGFGNASSDVDFLVLVPDGDERLSMPAVLFLSNRRVELRFRSARQILERASRLDGACRDGLNEESDVDEWHRFTHGRILRGAETIGRLREALRQERFNEMVAEWQLGRAQRAAQVARLFQDLGDPCSAGRWFRTALTYSAKSWLANQGSTYVEEKWLHHQLLQSKDDEPLSSRVRGLLAKSSLASEDVDVLTLLTPSLATRPLATLYPRIDRSTTTWRIAGHSHVVQRRADVYALSEPCSRVWRRLSRSRSFGESCDLMAPEVRASLLALWKCGLVGFRVEGRDSVIDLPELNLSFEAAGSISRISVHGAACFEQPLACYEVGASKFVTIGLALMWENILVENAVEDARGALTDEQWSVLRISIERVFGNGCRSMLLARGIHPCPEPGDAIAMLSRSTKFPEVGNRVSEYVVLANRYMLAGRYGDAWAATMSFIDLVREDGNFPRAFASQDEWRDTIGVGYDWVRLGAYMDSTFPTSETQEIVARSAPK